MDLEEIETDDQFVQLDVCEPDVYEPDDEDADQSVDSEVPDENCAEEVPGDEERSPLLISKSVNEDTDAQPSTQHVSVNDAMVLDALDVLDKQNVRGTAIETIVDYLALRLPVNRDKGQLLSELSEKLRELVDGGLVYQGQNGNYRLSLFHEEAQQAEGRFGEPAPTVPPRPKSGRSPSRDRAGRSRNRSGSTSTSSTSSDGSRYRSRSREATSCSSSRSPAPRSYPKLSPTFTKHHPRRSLRLKLKRQSKKR